MTSTCCTTFLGLAAFAMLGLVASQSLGPADFDVDGDVDLTDFAALRQCFNGPGAAPGKGCSVDADLDNDDDADLADFAFFQVAYTGRRVQAIVPAKSIGFDQIGIHDFASSSFDGDCISCHGDRLDEVSLDGVTPTAHSRMLLLFGEDNERCVVCHRSGTDFLSQSAANLREQVSTEDLACPVCHDESAGDLAWYVR